jgi:hypothetical protein
VEKAETEQLAALTVTLTVVTVAQLHASDFAFF